MNIFSHARRTVLGLVLAALVLTGGLSALVSASSLTPTVGHTGQALALRAALHPETGKAFQTAFLKAGKWPHAANGRFLADPKLFKAKRFQAVTSNPNPILISEGVQTFDVFAPPPSFAPLTGPLVPVNQHPMWSRDESYLVFSSNRDANGNVAGDGKFHIWAVLAKGGQVVQITSGPGNEDYPALNQNNNSILAFTSDANSAGSQNLYVIGGQTGVPFVVGQAPVDVSTLRTTATAKTLGQGGFTNVTRSTFSPGNDRIAFAATTTPGAPGHVGGVSHIFYLFLSNNGFQPQPAPGVANPPAQLTDGPASDTDPAWSPDGNFIAFASTAATVANTGQQISPTTSPSATTGPPVGRRGVFLINGDAASAFGTVPTSLQAAGGRVTVAGSDDFSPAWSFNLPNQFFNPNSNFEYLSFARGSAQAANHDIFYFRLTQRNTDNSVTITPETSGGGGSDSVRLNTDDPNNSFDDTYPTWAPFRSIFSMAYQSPRSVTYNTPGTNIPVEAAINLPRGTSGIGAGYTGLLESQVLNLDPPTLLRFSGSEVIHVNNQLGQTTRNIQPSVPGSPSTVTFTARLSNREAGIDDGKVFLQIKDPDSRYQDSQGLEHKVFANCNDVTRNPNGTGFNVPLNSGTARARLFNGGFSTGTNGNIGFRNGVLSGFTLVNNIVFGQVGAVGGFDPKANSTISVGHVEPGTDPNLPDPSNYRPWGPEYEAQYVNPTHLDPGIAAGDYGVPFYLAGLDDQAAFSGSLLPPRPTVDNPSATDARDRFAQWLQMTRLPDAQQDGQGGVLYQATYTTPTSSSDFYLDVIAYDKAVFPAVPADTSVFTGQSINWRIYDNVGGFTTATFNGNNDILVVVDNGLGQKFSATTFGGVNGNANLIPAFYGAESYYTDVDENLLPNATDFSFNTMAPVIPPVPAAQSTATPTNLKATPQNASVVLTFAGITPAPTSYRIFRSTTGDPGTDPANLIATIPGTSQTTYNDTAVTNGRSFFYRVTAVFSGNETGPSNLASTTPQNFGGIVGVIQKLSGFRTLNTLGVGSYDDSFIDDGARIALDPQANFPSPVQFSFFNDAQGSVSFVRPQRYSLWRILSRGTIPGSVLAGYQPSFQAQPAVNDTVNGVTAPAAPAVPVANRCVVWVSPYTGDLPLVDAGSLENPTTQDTLAAYVASGGRLCLTGQDVANATSLSGSVANAFLANTLRAKFASDAGGSQVLGGAGQRVTGYPGFNNSLGREYFILVDDPNGFRFVQSNPASGNLLLGNNFQNSNLANWRADSSLDQLGPNIGFFSSGLSGLSSNSIVSARAKIDTITANGAATQDMTTNGALGLQYYENFSTNADGSPAPGFGSRVVFGSFGLEGISNEYYRFDVGSKAFYSVRNQRARIMHSIVSYLRTGTFTGRVTQASGQGVAGAIVYLRPNGTVPGPRQLFSATTNFDGSFTISGVEPGTYSVGAYKTGFSTTTSNISFGIEGDSTANTGLVIAPVPPGRIQGKVTDSVTGVGVASVTVTFKSTDAQTTVFAVTGADGTYTIDNVPAGPYNGTASKLPQFQDATAPAQGNPIAVPSGGTAPADFSIVSNPATVSGTVFNDLDGDGNRTLDEPGINGVTVTFTPSTGKATPITATTAGGGLYTVKLPGGTFTVTAAANGFRSSSPRTITVQPGDVRTGVDIPLVTRPPILPGTLGGLVTDGFTGQALGGASVTVTDATGKVVAQVATGAATASPVPPLGDGQPLNYGPISLPPGTYNVAVTLSGFTGQTLSSLIVVSNAFTRADFTGQNGNPLQPLHVFPAGLNFVSLPFDYAGAGVGFDALFGTLNPTPRTNPGAGGNRSHVYVWRPQLVQYVADPTPPADAPRLGQGYWVYLINGRESFGAGIPPAAATISVGLGRGWNMIGVPSQAAVGVSRLTFVNPAGTGPLTFDQAASSTVRLVSPTLYGFDGAKYVPVTSGGALQPYQAYWIFAFVDTTVQIPTTGG